MVKTPLPSSLKSEAKKAAKILREFTIPSAKVGPDKLIPAGLVSRAQGLAILTVAKLGFLVTARGGSGIVIARLEGGQWSAPSAIGIAGLGGGFEIGAEVTDFIIILNKRAAVQAFSKGGNLTLGGNFTIAAGPLGRNVEGDISLRSTAAIYTYSRTKGLFAGISIGGSGLIERKDANKKFYGRPIRAYEILNGEVEPPDQCTELYEVLELHDEMFQKAALAYAKRQAVSEARKAAAGGGAVALLSKVKNIRRPSRGTEGRASRPSSTWYDRGDSGAAGGAADSSESDTEEGSPKAAASTTTATTTTTTTTALKVARKASPKGGETDSPWDRPPVARALWNFEGEMPCDLIFREGDEIEILTRTGQQDDWWEGKLNNRIGIFPANYVEVTA